MTQVWNPQSYEKDGAFVHELAGGVVEWLAARHGERILDLGCGDGQLTARLAATGAQVQGVDASPEMAAAARSRGLNVELANAEALPFAESAFDAVFSNAALHWVRNQDAMLAEVHRVLRPRGRFVVEMGGHGNIAAIRVALAAVLARYGFAELEKEVNYFPTPEIYARRLRENLFHVEHIRLIPRPTPLPAGGLEAWLRTFRSGVIEALPAELRATVVRETADLAARALRDEDGNWVADYVRLRFVARAHNGERL